MCYEFQKSWEFQNTYLKGIAEAKQLIFACTYDLYTTEV